LNLETYNTISLVATGNPYSDLDRHQNLIICSLTIANRPWKLQANPCGSFCAKLLTNT